MQIEQAVIDRFFAKTTLDHDEHWNGTKCLLWTASAGTGSGRGRFWDGERHWVAPQFAYVLDHGDLPAGMLVWQNCGNRLCVNHQHLESVSEAESARRANLRRKPAKTFRCCGRDKTDENSYISKHGGRRCRACQRAASKRWNQKPSIRRRRRNRRLSQKIGEGVVFAPL